MSQCNQVVIGGKSLVCDHCGNDAFSSRKAQLNTAQAMFFNAGWLNESASVFVCSNCGRIYWFLIPDGITPDHGSGAPFQDKVSPFQDSVSPFHAGSELKMETVPAEAGGDVREETGLLPDQNDGVVEGGIASLVEEEDAPASSEDELDENYDIECIQCGRIIPAGQSVCAKCGWTYKE